MTQTEPNTADQAEQAHRFPIHDDYDAHPGSSFDWRVEIIFEVEAGRVCIQDRWGDGTPAREYHRVNVRLATAKGSTYASMTPLVDYLEADEAQDLLATLAEGHSVAWDGNNHVGRLTDSAVTALERLERQLSDLFPDLPSYWSAADWFSGNRTADLTGSETDDDLAELARKHVGDALPDYHLQEDDVLFYLTEQRDRLKSADQDLQLVTLKEAATEDGHDDLAEMCDQALEGDPAAREACEIALVILQARDQGTVGEATEEVTRRLAEFRAAYRNQGAR